MKVSPKFLAWFVLISIFSLGANPAWQYGRIVEVKKSVTSTPIYWQVTTPVTRDVATYTIVVQLNREIVSGSYQPDGLNPEPPEEWVKDRAVQARLQGKSLLLRASAGEEIKIPSVKRKPATALMRPVTMEETGEKDPEAFATKLNPSTGPSAANPAPPPEPAPAPEPSGVVSVSTTPYLAEIFVDGKPAGYAPAKIILTPGKHTVRLEKQGYRSWTKELNVTEGSELPVTAVLTKTR